MLLFAIYIANKSESGKNIVSQGKVRKKINFKIMATQKLLISIDSRQQEQIETLQKHIILVEEKYTSLLSQVKGCCTNNTALGILIQTKVAEALSKVRYMYMCSYECLMNLCMPVLYWKAQVLFC